MDDSIIIWVVFAVLLFAGYTLFVRYRMKQKLKYMIDALEDKEYNFKFVEGRFFGHSLNLTLNRIRRIFEKERQELAEQERYYAHMLDHVKTGMMGLYDDGRIDFMNNQACALLGVGALSNIRQLRRVNEELYESFIKVQPGNDIKVSYFNESSQMNIILSASFVKIKKDEVKIVSFNDISSQLNENEVESWNKLTRVLTHEVMNAVSPIASLSDVLSSKAVEDKLNENYTDGLETIANSSRGLMKFVESYRNLTRVAPPVKKVLMVKELAEYVIKLTSQQAAEFGASVTYREKGFAPMGDAVQENGSYTEQISGAEELILYADQSQISQILINLIKNALQAGATAVEIIAETDSLDNVIINVSNNGAPISKESREEIFVPFYTTKQEGTGIGLALSRQIMRLHGGTLRLTRSDSTATVFSLMFR